MSSTPIYDFRDGLLDKESTYTDTSIDVCSHFLYFVIMGVCWCWGLAWYSLFYSFLYYYEHVACIVFICIFVVHFVIVITIGVINIKSSRRRKVLMRKQKEEMLKTESEIEKFRRRNFNAPKSKKSSKMDVNNNVDRRLGTEMQSLQ